jgi:quercetin dioxygenase-like cupin family protein
MLEKSRAAASTLPGIFAGLLIFWIAVANAQQPATTEAPRPPADILGITPEILVRTEVPGAPGKIAIVTRVTYQPGARKRKHYHTSQVVFYVLDGEMIVQNEGKEPVTLKPGETLLVKPGTVHAHWNASTIAKLVFLEFILLDEGQRSTVPVEE